MNEVEFKFKFEAPAPLHVIEVVNVQTFQVSVRRIDLSSEHVHDDAIKYFLRSACVEQPIPIAIHECVDVNVGI